VSDSKKLCLLTGYPGFLGSTFYHQFQTTYNHLIVDLSHGIPDIPDLSYDLVVHAAGRAHTVPRTLAEESLFFKVNHQGTVNLIRALEQLQEAPRALVLISSVAVYGKNEGQCISETEPLIANDAYGLSKIMGERARRLAEDKFNREEILEQYRMLFASLDYAMEKQLSRSLR